MKNLNFFLCLSFIFSAPLAIAASEAQFVLEYLKPDMQTVDQTITFKESEKQKNFTRLVDQAQCTMKMGEIVALVSSYRKIEMELECQAQYTKISSSFSCLFSDPNAPAAQLTERKNKNKQFQVRLGESHKGFKVRNSQKHHFKSAVTNLRPAWDASGCQNLGESLDHLGAENLRSRVRCCYLK